MKSTNPTYSVVVRNPNSWSASTGTHEKTCSCGHQHKSFAAAQACRSRLTAWRDGSTSARWYHSRIEDSDGYAIAQDGSRLPTKEEQRKAEFQGM